MGVVPLFIDRQPLTSWTGQTQTPPVMHWSVSLPVLASDPGLPMPPSGAPVVWWFLDTGHAGDAFAWRHHLVAAGLDPDQRQAPVQVALTTSVAGRMLVPIREADLWLVSNVPAFRNSPFRLPLGRGIPFRNVPLLPDPHLNRLLIGMRALHRAHLRLEIDCAGDTVSVWTPDPSAMP
jgi:hypothetical protein